MSLWAIGAAVVGGTAAGVGGGMAGRAKKGSWDLGQTPLPDAESTDVGNSLKDIIMGSLGKEQVGLPQGLRSAMGDQARSSFNEQIIPQMQSQAAASGMSRSSMLPRNIMRGQGEMERDLAVRQGEFDIASEKFKEQQKQARRALALQYNAQDLAQRNAFAADEKSKRAYQQNKKAAFDKAQSDNVYRAIGTGFGAGSSIFGMLKGGGTGDDDVGGKATPYVPITPSSSGVSGNSFQPGSSYTMQGPSPASFSQPNYSTGNYQNAYFGGTSPYDMNAGYAGGGQVGFNAGGGNQQLINYLKQAQRIR